MSSTPITLEFIHDQDLLPGGQGHISEEGEGVDVLEILEVLSLSKGPFSRWEVEDDLSVILPVGFGGPPVLGGFLFGYSLLLEESLPFKGYFFPPFVQSKGLLVIQEQVRQAILPKFIGMSALLRGLPKEPRKFQEEALRGLINGIRFKEGH